VASAGGKRVWAQRCIPLLTACCEFHTGWRKPRAGRLAQDEEFWDGIAQFLTTPWTTQTEEFSLCSNLTFPWHLGIIVLTLDNTGIRWKGALTFKMKKMESWGPSDNQRQQPDSTLFWALNIITLTQ
jgi:hypothetical protein